MYLKKTMQYESKSNLPKCFRPIYEPSSKWQSINYNRTKYFYNQKSLSFEKVTENKGYMFWRILGVSSLIIVSVTILSIIISRYITDSYAVTLAKKNKETLFEIEQMQRELDVLDNEISELREKDENIYRAIYGVEPP